MKLEVLPNADAVALRAAQFVAEQARAAAKLRAAFTLAVSGGRTPWQMLRSLAREPVQWDAVHLFQVDERVAPAGDADRNLTHIHETLLARVALPAGHVHAMPVEENDLWTAAARYQHELEIAAGSPAQLDLVHLGLGADGHTASLVPGDPVLEVCGVDVALTGMYQNRRRMTLTYRALNAARLVLWVVTGADKRTMLERLLDGDTAIPAGRVEREHAVVLVDRDAAGSRLS